MSETDVYSGPTGYPLVAGVRGQEVLLYQQFGSYQGEWMMLARTPEHFYVYKDWYGSCSGCDNYEAEMGYDGITMAQALKFAEAYPPFIEIPKDTMRNLLSARTLGQVLPANIRGDYSDIDLDSFTADMMLAAKLSEGMDLTVLDITVTANQELKQRALKFYGYERFVADVAMEEIDREGENALLRNGDIVFAYVKDSSTPRRYLLRVPPQMTRVRDAIAWTFGMTADEYCPLVET